MLFTLPCTAEDIIEEIMEYSGADNLDMYLPESVTERGIAPNPEKPELERIVSELASMLFSGLRAEFRGFTGLCAFLCICAVIRLHGGLFESGGRVAEYICILGLSLYCHRYISGALDSVTRAINEIDTFMSTMLPVMTSLYAVSGNGAAAVAQNAGMYAAITFFEKINSSVLMPMFNFCFALAIVCRTSSVNLAGIVKFIRNFIVRCCVTVLTVLTAVLFFNSTFSAAADTLAMRGVRYAASFIPIVGALAGEAARTVAASIAVIKTSAGIFAVTAVIYTAAIPCIILICKKTLLTVCTVIAQVMGASNEAAFIEEINNILSILLAITVSVGIFFILAVTIFIKTAVAV